MPWSRSKNNQRITKVQGPVNVESVTGEGYEGLITVEPTQPRCHVGGASASGLCFWNSSVPGMSAQTFLIDSAVEEHKQHKSSVKPFQ